MLTQKYFLDVQSLSGDLREEILRKLAVDREVTNDSYVFYSVDLEEESDYPVLDAYLKENGVSEVLISIWW